MAGDIAVEWMKGPWRDDTQRPPFLSSLGLGSLVLAFPLGLGGSEMFVAGLGHDWFVTWNGDPVSGLGWLASAGVLGVLATLGAFRLMFGGARSMAVVASFAWLAWSALLSATTGAWRPLAIALTATVLVVGGVLLDRIPEQHRPITVRPVTPRRGRRR